LGTYYQECSDALLACDFNDRELYALAVDPEPSSIGFNPTGWTGHGNLLSNRFTLAKARRTLQKAITPAPRFANYQCWRTH